LRELESALGARWDAGERLRRWCGRRPLGLYLGTIAVLAAASAAILTLEAYRVGAGVGWLAATAVLAALAGSQLGVSLANLFATLFTTPRALPRMDFSEGIPAECRTLVVVPTMLVGADLDDLVEALEVRFLANRDNHLHFGLLTDFPDADELSRPGDEALLALARG